VSLPIESESSTVFLFSLFIFPWISYAGDGTLCQEAPENPQKYGKNCLICTCSVRLSLKMHNLFSDWPTRNDFENKLLQMILCMGDMEMQCTLENTDRITI